MRKVLMSFGFCLLPLAAMAGNQVQVEILSPAAGECVNNPNSPFTGGIAGGEAVIDVSDITVRARFSQHEGQQIELNLTSDGDVIGVQFLDPPDSQPFEADITFNAFGVQEGNRTLGITATAEGGAANSASVAVRVDRLPPVITFDLDDLDAAQQEGVCYDAPPEVAFVVADGQGASNHIIRNDENGCELSRVVVATDDCGNTAESAFSIRRLPTPGQLTGSLNGFRCGLERCVTDGPDARPFAEGDRIGSGSVTLDLQGDANCFDGLNTTFTIDGADAGVFQFDAPLEAPGDYVVALSITACGDEIGSDDLSFTVLDRPVADSGGPYEVAQGAPLTLDAGNSTAAPELGGIVEYAWDVDGDGFYDQIAELRGAQWFNQETDAPLPNPARAQFDTTVGDGEYTVQIRITSGNGGVEFANGTITVTDVSPTCVITGPAAGTEGQAVTFIGSESAVGHESDPIISYGWTFGDDERPQNAANLTEASHIYGGGGTFTVTLTVFDQDSSTSCTTDITIDATGPIVEGVAAFNADRLLEGVEVGFTAGATRPGSAFTPLQSFNWTFGPPAAQEAGEGLHNPRYTYNDDGDYEVCLEVFDVEAATDSECINITIADLEPIAVLVGDRFGVEGETLSYNADQTRGSPADELSAIIWDFGDGTVERTQPPVFRMDHVFDGSGEFMVTITAVDEDSEMVSEPIIVNIEDVVPRVSVEVVYEVGQLNGIEGEPITFDASGSTPGSEVDPIVDYAFDFGDGTVVSGEEAVVEHIYVDQGVFEVTVTVTDSDGSTAGTTVIAVTVNRPPTVSITVDNPQAEIGEFVVFHAVIDDVEGDLPLPKIRWNFGDGNIVDGEADQPHAFQGVGEFEVTVEVDDFDGNCVVREGLPAGACSGDNPPPSCECPGLRPNVCDQRAECRLTGGDASASTTVEITRAAPRIEAVGPFEVNEGELLTFRVRVDAAQSDDDPEGNPQFDGPTVIGVPSIPDGATTEVIPNGDEAESQFLEFSWRPSFFDAGEHVIRVTAVGPLSQIDRTREITITVNEGGTPFLVGAGGRANRGVVTVYEYTRDGGVPGLTARAQVEVGAGAGGLAVNQEKGEVYVAVPGSGGLAVVSIGDDPKFLRRVPTGAGTSSVVWSPGYAWAVNALDNTITAVDTETLKVVDSIDPGVERPSDLVWLPDGFDGLEGAHLAVIGTRSGEVALIDPMNVLDGIDGNVASYRVGGVLTRIVADESTGKLHIADGKTRRIYHVSAASMLAEPSAESTDITFGARDLLAVNGDLWIATDGGLVHVVDGDAELDPAIVAKALADVSGEILDGSGIAAAVGDRVENFNGDLNRVLGAAGSRIRRLAAFIARQ